MLYRVYNTQTQNLGRILDNTRGLVLQADEVLLEVIIETKPTYDPATQYITVSEDINLTTETWTKSYTVHDKDPVTIAREDWVGTYNKRIVAPMSMITDQQDHTGVKFLAWFQAQELPIEKSGQNVRLYCNQILPEHQAVVDAYQGVITIEDYPT